MSILRIFSAVWCGMISITIFGILVIFGWHVHSFPLFFYSLLMSIISVFSLIILTTTGDFDEPQSLENFWHEQSEWSEATFGKEKGCIGALKHLAKEVQETLEDPTDLEEYADMMHLIFDACRRAGFSYDQLLKACYNKLQKNKKRKWGPVVADQPCEHIAEG